MQQPMVRDGILSIGRESTNNMKKYFIITIDTEGDNIWKRVTNPSGLRKIEVENAKYIARFQTLCEKYQYKPTYLVNYEMAGAEPFVSQAKEWQRSGQCEIGMHMHAWNTPPIYHLPFNRRGHNPYAGEYSRKILWQKMRIMTETIEKVFDVKPYSHRGGRWYIDSWYIRALLRLGYQVDCSVTPGIDWGTTIGNTMYGPDYSEFPTDAYYMNSRDLRKPMKQGDSAASILQVPPTIIAPSLPSKLHRAANDPWKVKEIWKERIWLRPTGSNLEEMLYIVGKTKERDYIEFMLHSSELMPGGSPTFKTERSIEKLYSHLNILFAEIGKTRTGITLSEYATLYHK